MADTAATPSVHVPSTLEQRKYDEALESGAAPSEATELSRATPAPGSTWHEPQGEAPDMEAAASRADTAARVAGVEPEPEQPTTSVAVRAPRTPTRTRTTAAATAKARPSTKASAPSAGAKKATSKKR